VIVVAAAAVLLGLSLAEESGSSEAGTPAPDITLEYFDGTAESLTALIGKPVVLNFWASWCPACVGEMPDFAEVHRLLGDRVHFVGVNMQEVSVPRAIELARITGVEYRLAHDPEGAIFRAFGALAMPATVFIDSEGRISRVHNGVIFFDDLMSLVEAEL
jgi:cytochrome c biogenesis protein CcmG, thiol:disulfide interchange protein DsbE